MICGQTRVQAVSVSQVGPRYDVNAILVLAWLRDPRFSDGAASDVVRSLPLESGADAGGYRRSSEWVWVARP